MPKRTDANQTEIVNALRKAYCKVFVTSEMGKGFPDLVVYIPTLKRLFLVEIKDGSKPPSQRKLTKDEANFHQEWEGCVHIISSVDEAMKLVLNYYA